MAWKYDLGATATALRTTIMNSEEDAEGCLATLNALRACYAKVKELLTEEDYVAYGFDEMAEEMEIIRSGIEFGDDDDDEAVANTDYALGVFYDLCDDCRIWVTL
jgi:hypothetical protein